MTASKEKDRNKSGGGCEAPRFRDVIGALSGLADTRCFS